VVDTAQALVLAEASRLLLEGRARLPRRCAAGLSNTNTRCRSGGPTGSMPRPITFGLKLALWYDELMRGRDRLEAAAHDLRVGKLSGVVGTFGHVAPYAEERSARD
jgi:adenylosuccinate lyase